jgi:hypothetical protein
LELHCRQKARGVQPKPAPYGVVADQQQEYYSQLINKIRGQALGQLVGDLWIGCAPLESVPHGGLRGFLYAAFCQWLPSILSKNVVSSSKS